MKEFRHHTKQQDFNREWTMLQKVAGLEHRHLVQLLTAIRKGDNCYLIFPLAKSSLADYFKKDFMPHDSAKDARNFVIWFLEQLSGLADALSKVHDFPGTSNGSHEKNTLSPLNLKVGLKAGYEKGYHHDIKAGNILLFTRLGMTPGREYDDRTVMCEREREYGRLQLTDLGLGKIREANDKSHTSHIKNTPTYAAPETLTSRPRQGRKSDIWAFGCVLLEVMVYLMEGPQGLATFSKNR